MKPIGGFIVAATLAATLATQTAAANSVNGTLEDRAGNFWFAQTYLHSIAFIVGGCAYKIGVTYNPGKLVEASDGTVWTISDNNKPKATWITSTGLANTVNLPGEFVSGLLVPGDAGTVWAVSRFRPLMVKIGRAGVQEQIATPENAEITAAASEGEKLALAGSGHLFVLSASSGKQLQQQVVPFQVLSLKYDDGNLWALTAYPYAIARMSANEWHRFPIPLPNESRAWSLTDVDAKAGRAVVGINEDVFEFDGIAVSKVATLPSSVTSVSVSNRYIVVTNASDKYALLKNGAMSWVDITERILSTIYACNSDVTPLQR